MTEVSRVAYRTQYDRTRVYLSLQHLISIGDVHECWPWQGEVSHDFGVFTYLSETFFAHKVSYETHFRRVPDHKTLAHYCRNKLCCNPHHMRPLSKGLFNKWEASSRIVTPAITYRKNSGRARRIKSKYRMSLSDVEHMMRQQNGCCAICTRTFDGSGVKAVIDHNHSTGAVRGLLCGHCNTLLGFCREDINTLRAAIAYLTTE